MTTRSLSSNRKSHLERSRDELEGVRDRPSHEEVLPPTDREVEQAREWLAGLGPASEAGVGLVCQDCEFATVREAKADAHFALTGHAIAIDYVPHESEWPTLDRERRTE